VPYFKYRIQRIANALKVLHFFREVVDLAGKASNSWNASSSALDSALKEGDIKALAAAILENRKQAARFSYNLEKYERILAKIGDEQNDA